MKEAHKHRITGFNSSHLSYTPVLKTPNYLQKTIKQKWENAKAFAHSRGILGGLVSKQKKDGG